MLLSVSFSQPNADFAYANANAAVWRYEAGSYWSAAWVDTSNETLVGNYAGWKGSDLVADLAFSPNFDVDNTIVALTVGDVVTTQNIGTYKGYWLQAGEWGNLKLWNAEGGYGSYPVLIKNGSDAIVAPLDPQLGSDVGHRRTGPAFRLRRSALRLHG